MCAATCSDLSSDPIVTRAMKASTISENRVTENSVRVELEIGLADLKAFHNVLPDELYQKLELGTEPLRDRIAAFFLEDWVLRADGGEPILGRLDEVVGRRRVRRDDVTGEPLPAKKDEGEVVVFVVLSYTLEGRPKTLTFARPTSPGWI